VRRLKPISDDLSSLDVDCDEEATRSRSLDSTDVIAESGRDVRGLGSSCGSMTNGGKESEGEAGLIAERAEWLWESLMERSDG
jgi:hypothetical protein